MSCCCGGWFKRKPGDSHGSQERPSTDPPGSVENAENTSTDPLVQTAQNPSDGSKDHLLVETAKRPSLSTTPIGPSSSKKPPTTLEEVVGSLKEVDIARLGDFIDAIKQLLERLAAQKDTQDTASLSSSNVDTLSRWASIIQTGKTFLSFVSDQAEKVDTKNEFFKSGEATKIAGDVLQHIGQIHWMVGVLSITGYLISKCQKVSENRTGYIELLQNILELASYIKNLNILIPENEKKEKKEKLENAFQYIIEGSMFSAAQLNSGKFCSFFKSSINSQTLCAIRSKISDLYQDLNSIVNIEMLQGQPVSLPLSLPEYPKEAVGIEDQLKEVNNLLNMETTEDCSSLIVLIWGFGGIGKTTLAQAVVSKIDRSRYNYARIILDEISENNKNKYTEMQKNILKDAFPNYMGGREINLRDNEDGKDKLREACIGKGNKAVFLYIDNALHKNDLEELLPKDLGCLPQQSRILITTRTMDIADMLQKRGFSDRIKDYPVKTLSHNDAMEILCKDCSIRDHIKEDLKKIVNVCKGIPLVLEIVGADLQEENYDANRCTQTIEDLNEGKDINDLSDRMFHFIYKKLDEATKDAFLDICCCFNNSERRRFVEDIVGTREVRRLLKAALITSVKVKISLWSGEEEERLTVHDIIGSIGRRLGKPSRIMDRNAWAVAEKTEARLKKIKAVILPHGTEGYTLEEEHLNSMKERLRILVWDGCINVSVTEVVKLPELRQVTISGDISWLNVEALNKLVILECHGLPTPQIGLLTLPKCLRRISISKLVQPADTRNFLKMVPNSSLEELHLIFEDTESSTEEEVNSVDAFPEAIDTPDEDEYNIINV